MDERGRFVVLEGIDGSGTTTQMNLLHDHIKSLSKYNDVLTTHEPWKNDEIKKMLANDENAYSDALKMTELFVEDRKRHVCEIINYNLMRGVFILSDRYALSTFAYQETQGVDHYEICKLHEKDIAIPDLTLFLDVDLEVAKQRIAERGEDLEKFERDEEFTKRLIETYRKRAFAASTSESSSVENILGRIVRIEGNNSKKQVATDISLEFNKIYDCEI